MGSVSPDALSSSSLPEPLEQLCGALALEMSNSSSSFRPLLARQESENDVGRLPSLVRRMEAREKSSLLSWTNDLITAPTSCSWLTMQLEGYSRHARTSPAHACLTCFPMEGVYIGPLSDISHDFLTPIFSQHSRSPPDLLFPNPPRQSPLHYGLARLGRRHFGNSGTLIAPRKPALYELRLWPWPEL